MPFPIIILFDIKLHIVDEGQIPNAQYFEHIRLVLMLRALP